MIRLLNHCLIFFRREQRKEAPQPVKLTEAEFRLAVAQAAANLRRLL